MKNDITKIEFRILIKDGGNYYYILKLEHHDSETLCFYPDAGFHFTEHESGEAHIRVDKNKKRAAEGIPIAVTTGEAGEPFGSGFRHKTPKDLGVGYSITDLLVPLDSLHSDFRKYDRSIEECFVIDKDQLPKDTSLVRIGIWYVPSRNKVSFEFNNPGIPEYLLYKVVQCEPQIWAFAVPFS
jgi:hypothetical protein